MAGSLEQITWKPGKYFVNAKGKRVNPKPIGNTAMGPFHTTSEDIQERAEEHLLNLQRRDEAYEKVNAYSIANGAKLSEYIFEVAFNFYKI